MTVRYQVGMEDTLRESEMRALRYVARNVSVINVLLAGSLAAVMIYAILPLLSAKTVYQPSGRQRGTANRL